jgi:hypothetical protein
MATVMNTIFRTIACVIGLTVGSVLLAWYVSPLVVQTFGFVVDPPVPNETASMAYLPQRSASRP